MNLLVPIFVRRGRGGFYEAWTLGEPSVARKGRILETVKTQLAQLVRKAITQTAAGDLALGFVPHGGRHELVHVKTTVRGARGEKKAIDLRLSVVISKAPGNLPGMLARIPRAGERVFVHVPPDRDLREVVTHAVAQLFEGSPEDLLALGVERSESIQLLDVELSPPALIDRQRAGDDGLRGLLSGLGKSREKRTKEDLRNAPTLLEVGLELTADARGGRLGRAHAREAEVTAVLDALTEGRPRAVVLVGEPGVGKTAIVQEVAHRLAARQEENRWSHHRGALFSISAGRLIAGMRYVGQWQERCYDLIEEAVELGAVVHAESLPELLAAGRTSRRERTGAASLLRPSVASGELALVAETTPEGLRRATELDRSFTELLRVIRVREPAPQETLSIALRTVREVELEARVAVSPLALRTSLELLRRFVPYEAFPGKAVRFLRRLPESRPADEGRTAIGPEQVLERFAGTFGLARRLLEDSVPLDPESVRSALETRVLGQREAVDALVSVVSTLMTGLKDPDKPLASFVFIGPTGTGKTEAAKALAELLFGSEERLVRFDLNEASDAGAVERLAGSIYRPEGSLVRAIRDRPFAVVLLDEVEKAHPAVLDLLLQLLGEGRLTDALGRTADARNVVFVLTSNLGAERADRDLGFGAAPSGDRYRRAVEEFFRPELVNRLDRIVAFEPLARPALRAIAVREVQALLAREGVARRPIYLEVEDAVLDGLVARGTDPRYGARPLRRAVERSLAAPLAAVLAAHPPGTASLVALRAAAGSLGDAKSPENADVTITLQALEGTGPVEPGPRPVEASGRPAEQVRELARRLERLEASAERRAVQEALVAADSGRAPLAPEAFERLGLVEVALADLREGVAAVAGPLEVDDFEETGGEDPGEDDGLHRPRHRLRYRWTKDAAVSVPPRPLEAAWHRLARVELLVQGALRPAERVLLHIQTVGSVDATGWVEGLARLHAGFLEALGVPVTVLARVSGAWAPEPCGFVSAVEAELRGHLGAGRAIQAIKRYREVTRVGLKEAKDAIDGLRERQGAGGLGGFADQTFAHGHRELLVETSFPGASTWLAGEAGLHERFRATVAAPRGLAPGALASVAVVLAEPGVPVESALLRATAAPLRVVRKYVVGAFVHDVDLGCAALALTKARNPLVRPFEEILLAKALAAGEKV